MERGKLITSQLAVVHIIIEAWPLAEELFVCGFPYLIGRLNWHQMKLVEVSMSLPSSFSGALNIKYIILEFILKIILYNIKTSNKHF